MAAGLHALSDDDVHAGAARADGRRHGADLMDDGQPCRVCRGDKLCRIPPEERQGGDPFLQAELNAVTMGEVEVEVHAEGFVG